MERIIKNLLLVFISFYQKVLSPIKNFLRQAGFFFGSGCVLYPTCSEYAKQAIKKYGALKGTYLFIVRILRCHPWQRDHFDPVK